jgi:hypothetical protein
MLAASSLGCDAPAVRSLAHLDHRINVGDAAMAALAPAVARNVAPEPFRRAAVIPTFLCQPFD